MSVTTPQGFLASGVAAGIKEGKPDLAVVVNPGPEFSAAAVFTSNRFQAAPVRWSQQAVKNGQLQAVVLNSGGANACTGEAGYADAIATAAALAKQLEIDTEDVAVCSTGLIGVRLPMDAVFAGIEFAVAGLSSAGGADAATAIMTTDTVPKTAEYVDQAGWSIGGMAKGAGMLAPALATMLVCVTTDASVPPAVLDRALRAAVSLTFDRADSDGCMSTNDTVLALANGASGISVDEEEFTTRLAQVCWSLARQLIADAEGAEHDIEVRVTGAASEADALEVARAIARSNLFKCAVFGNDPNWGRVLSAAGTCQAEFDPEHVDVLFNSVEVFRDGQLGEDRAKVDLGNREVLVEVRLHAGEASASIWTNDLTYGYVKENAEYST
ncbi:MAG: bifunctional glutamate N-acetyltransferase/amino-acid acetyltransferase ArgJ [Propionibacteriaceae bacterium]|jgi:glutamate N-acetyltransferase/amino-acid N-acetyltransferase|nr:bifunctional glutamate N-acetyltransferase/amino-acid acetyltransferase ArgJ [Propionibacteriaceae bacterium]